MVRRRANKVAANKVAAVLISNGEEFLTNGVASAVNSNLFDDQYFASPKRKDCKIDNSGMDATCYSALDAKCKPLLTSKHKTERTDAAGRIAGAPLATRSQTKTLEKFFEKKSTQNKQKDETSEKKANIQKISTPLLASVETSEIIETELGFPEAAFNRQTELFDFSEDTYDTDTDISDEVAAAVAKAIDFAIHRSPLRDSQSSGSSTTENIFLQEPVLTLNVDKSLNQASSIKINKSLEVEPVFSLPPSLTAATLNGRFNQIVSLNGSPSKRDSFSFESKSTVKGLIPDTDNSSCDSGVVFTTSSDNNFSPLTQATRRRKPATPHRIVCPSPVKSMPRNGTSEDHSTISSKGQLSPRKSPRTAAAAKTRRRLTHQHQHQKEKPNHKTALIGKLDATIQNGCKHNDYTANEDIGLHPLLDEDIHAAECDILEEKECAASNKYTPNACHIVNLTKHTVQKSTNNNWSCQTTKNNQKSKSTAPKSQQPKTKLTQPLTSASNGSRELTEFFPVRRSVRKTKTAVKEEMMRNIEKSILEERDEGLRVANFEGKGRGIVADRHFQRGEFVVEYIGDLISIAEATEREQRYALDENAGCYMYYFKHKNQQYCIDATIDTGKLGRLVNHSRNGNLITKVVVVKQRPHLILIAKEDVMPGEELTYDYGDRSKESLLHHPWLAF